MALKNISSLAKSFDHDAWTRKYQSQAEQLKKKIRKTFWDESQSSFRSYLLDQFFPKPGFQFDLLGNSLAILFDVATPHQAALIVSNYPLTPAGPPVFWPQKKNAPIYHNRAIWPFVTAFFLLAAKKVKNEKAFDNAMDSLIKGSALNLSNMENFEFTSLKPFLKDGTLSGPVINSRRQLWSVAGYGAAIIRGIFGIEFKNNGLIIEPFITQNIAHQTFYKEDTIELSNLAFQSKKVNLKLRLIKKDEKATHYLAGQIKWNQDSFPVGEVIPYIQMNELNDIEIVLYPEYHSTAKIKLLQSPEEIDGIFAPPPPNLSIKQDQKGLTCSLKNIEKDCHFNIYRNGKIAVRNGSNPTWIDKKHNPNKTAVYFAEVIHPSSQIVSPPSALSFFEPPQALQVIKATEEIFYGVDDPLILYDFGHWHFHDWGEADQELVIHPITTKYSGRHLIQLTYGNAFNAISTGISACVKTVRLSLENGPTLYQGSFIMPHLKTWETWGNSNFLKVKLEAQKKYQIKISDGFNMSYLQHFNNYLANGGINGSINRANILKLKLLRY